jgi:protein-disulfide isomerase
MISRDGRTRWANLILILTLMVAGALFGCDDAKSQSGQATKSDEQARATGSVDRGDQSAEAMEQAEEAAPNLQAPRGNIYPGINLAILSAEQRTRFVSIAESELCPCEDSTESLHACLQKQDRCGTASQVAGVIGHSIMEGLNPTDTLDRVAKFLEASRKVYEFTLEGVPFKGSASAKVVIVEFADFQCPHCREAARVLEQIAGQYGDQIAVYFKQFPLGSLESQLAAQATLAAHKQGQFWGMHDLLFQNQTQISAARIERFARQLGLNFERFQADMASPEVVAAIARDRQEALAANISGTPAIFINGRTYLDDKSPAALSRAIDAALEESK